MSHYLAGAIVTLECPHCGDQVKETVSDLETKPWLRCGECCGMFRVDRGQLRAALAQFATAANAYTAGRAREDRSLESLPVLVTH